TYKNSIQKLTEELKSAIVHNEDDMPKDVIRFDSLVTIERNNGFTKLFALVIPSQRHVLSCKIYIFTPMGAALIGYAKRDVLIWEFRKGEQTLTVSDVKQQANTINTDILL